MNCRIKQRGIEGLWSMQDISIIDVWWIRFNPLLYLESSKLKSCEKKRWWRTVLKNVFPALCGEEQTAWEGSMSSYGSAKWLTSSENAFKCPSLESNFIKDFPLTQPNRWGRLKKKSTQQRQTLNRGRRPTLVSLETSGVACAPPTAHQLAGVSSASVGVVRKNEPAGRVRRCHGIQGSACKVLSYTHGMTSFFFFLLGCLCFDGSCSKINWV